jgi:hypothetical protein
MVRMENKKKLKYLFFVSHPDHPNILLNFLCDVPHKHYFVDRVSTRIFLTQASNDFFELIQFMFQFCFI